MKSVSACLTHSDLSRILANDFDYTDKTEAKKHQPALDPSEDDEQPGKCLNAPEKNAQPADLETIAGPSARLSPSKRKSSTSNESPRKKMSRVQSPERRPSAERDESMPLPDDQPSAPNRGTVRSVTNPEFIPNTKRKNPFFETMPGPEVWHRRMAPYFPFGETPYMERVMSEQITADLARGMYTLFDD